VKPPRPLTSRSPHRVGVGLDDVFEQGAADRVVEAGERFSRDGRAKPYVLPAPPRQALGIASQPAARKTSVSGFAPKSGREPSDVPAELVRAIAEASCFPSRAAKASPQPARRPPRIHRTGRTMQFNARTTPQTVEALYAIADQQGWLVGETLERALAALQRELAGRGA
jgi:hypothetical protein